MTIDFEFINGFSVGFEIVTDEEIIGEFINAIILVDIFILRLVMSV